MTAAIPPAIDDLVIERDFLLCLVDLVDSDAPDQLSTTALRLIAQRAGAERAYLQLGDIDDPNAVSWTAAIGFGTAERAAIRRLLSTTIVRQALATKQTIETMSAATDPRFGGLDSVQRNHIEAVLCLPIGAPVVGVLYLQAHASGHRFPPAAKSWAERFVAHLRPIVRRLLQARPEHDATLAARGALVGVDAIVGKSPVLAAALRWAATVAPRDVSVLVTGPSGSGKSLLASVIAASAPGSALVDDIEARSPEEQAALAHSDARIIATTKVRLDERVAAGAFREDLYHRIAGATYIMPSLDERRGDIPLIAERFLAEASARHGLPAMTLSPTAQQALLVADWPGEVRQLGTVVYGAALRAHGDRLTTLDPSCLFSAASKDSLGARPLVAWQIAIRDCQRRTLKDALEVTNGNITEAARRLGIARSYAYELVRDLNLR